MKKSTLIFGLVFSLAAVSFAQVRTITNSTLERIQGKRLAAERDYRDNYERMGFPSPEELDRQRESDMDARVELAEQLRRARLEKERLDLERRSLDIEANRFDAEAEATQFGGVYGGYIGGFGGGFSSRDRHGRFRGYFPTRGFFGGRLLPFYDRRGAYRVTPFGVIPVYQQSSPRIGFRSGPAIRVRRR